MYFVIIRETYNVGKKPRRIRAIANVVSSFYDSKSSRTMFWIDHRISRQLVVKIKINYRLNHKPKDSSKITTINNRIFLSFALSIVKLSSNQTSEKGNFGNFGSDASESCYFENFCNLQNFRNYFSLSLRVLGNCGNFRNFIFWKSEHTSTSVENDTLMFDSLFKN
jgi:hypothetical protein